MRTAGAPLSRSVFGSGCPAATPPTKTADHMNKSSCETGVESATEAVDQRSSVRICRESHLSGATTAHAAPIEHIAYAVVSCGSGQRVERVGQAFGVERGVGHHLSV